MLPVPTRALMAVSVCPLKAEFCRLCAVGVHLSGEPWSTGVFVPTFDELRLGDDGGRGGRLGLFVALAACGGCCLLCSRALR